MLHARRDYRRIQDLAVVAEMLLEEAGQQEVQGNEAAALALEWILAKLEKSYGPLIGVEPIPEKEPVFLLRAPDMTAPHIVRAWAQMAKKHGAAEKITQSALNQADAMKAWQREHGRKIPDMPEAAVEHFGADPGTTLKSPCLGNAGDHY